MKFQTMTRPLRDLVKEFHSGDILLPQFQRDYVWKPAKIRNLLDSLHKNYPIGGFYLWRPDRGPLITTRDKALGKQHSGPGPLFVGYLIDGQQRLTSLEAAFGLYAGEDKRGDELRCYLDLKAPDTESRRDTRLFVTYAGNNTIRYRVDSGDSTLIPISQLFDGQDHELRNRTEEVLRHLQGWKAKRIDLALWRFDRACDLLNLQIPCTTISEVSEKEAIEVFNRLNKGGTALKQGDVRAAELAQGHTVVVLKNMREFVAGELPQRLGFGFSFAFRALVLFHRGSAQFESLRADWVDTPGPHGRSLADSWRVCEQAISAALKFVDERMGWSRRTLLPSGNAVIVLAAAFEKADFKLGPDDDQLYRRWLCLTALRGVFQGSVETTINRFYKTIKESKKGVAQALVGRLKQVDARKVRADEINRYAQLWGPTTQVMHAWLVNQEAQDWRNGESVNVLARSGNLSFPGGDLTVHHIFPRKVLSGIYDDPNYANCPANYALLSRSTNAEFGDNTPEQVLAMLSPNKRESASAQFFGEDAGDRLKVDQYEEFCKWRAGKLAAAINEWLGMG